MSEQTVEQHKAAIAAEWNKYTAAEVIYLKGQRAFNEGDSVPVSHVEGFDRPEVVDGVPTGKTEHVDPVVLADQVKKVTTKKAASAATKES